MRTVARRDAGSACGGRCRAFPDRELVGSRFAARCTAHRRAAASVTPRSFDLLRRHAVAELFELSYRKILRPWSDHFGLFDQLLLLRGVCDNATSPFADQIGVGLMPGVEQKMQLCSNSSRSGRRHCPRPGSDASARLDRVSGFARRRATRIQIAEEILHRLVAAGKRLRARSPVPARPKSPATQSRNVRAPVAAHRGRLPITSIGIAEAKSSIRSTSPCGDGQSSRSTSGSDRAPSRECAAATARP